MGLTHFDDAFAYELSLGHLRGRWSSLAQAAGDDERGTVLRVGTEVALHVSMIEKSQSGIEKTKSGIERCGVVADSF